MKKYKKGFTLIELLVVIAIIGILSAVVLASLSNARDKGKDASGKTSLSSIRSSAENYYSGTGGNSYGEVSGVTPGTVTSAGVEDSLVGVCNDDDMKKLLSASAVQADNTATCSVGSISSSNTTAGDSYEAHVTLKDGSIFCVDSASFAGIATSPTTGTAGTDARCQ